MKQGIKHTQEEILLAIYKRLGWIIAILVFLAWEYWAFNYGG